jgi:prefoldin subunit 5
MKQELQAASETGRISAMVEMLEETFDKRRESLNQAIDKLDEEAGELTPQAQAAIGRFIDSVWEAF